MVIKIGKNILIAFDLEIFIADFHSDDLLICQGRMKAYFQFYLMKSY